MVLVTFSWETILDFQLAIKSLAFVPNHPDDYFPVAKFYILFLKICFVLFLITKLNLEFLKRLKKLR